MAAVSLEGISKIFPAGATALSGLNLAIADGELLAIVGPSGSGKTTVLRLIAGLEVPTEGRVLFDGHDMAGIPPRDRNVAMVQQDGVLYTHMSARLNIGFPLKVRRIPKEKSDVEVETEADHLGIAALLGRMPGELSAGHRHAVATARALVRESRVLLLDEPLASLDRQSRVRMRVELARLHQELGVTMVYVTNDQTEAMALGQRVAVLTEHGRLAQVAPPRDIYLQPVDLFVARFVGHLNCVMARLERGMKGWALAVGADRLVLGPALPPAIEDYLNSDVVVGIRPEHLRPAPPGTPFQRCLHGCVTRVEDTGPEVRLWVKAGEWNLEGRVPSGSRMAVGELVEVAVGLDRLLFFDPDTGLAL